MKFALILAVAILVCVDCQQSNSSSEIGPLQLTTHDLYAGNEITVYMKGRLFNRSVDDITYSFDFQRDASYKGKFGFDSDRGFGAMFLVSMLDIRANSILKRNMGMKLVLKTNNNDTFEFNLKGINVYAKSPFNVRRLATRDFTLQINFDLSCSQNVGPNCVIDCPIFNPAEEFCDPIDGRIRFINLTRHQADTCQVSSCSDFSHCYITGRSPQCECEASFCGDICDKIMCSRRCNQFFGACDLSGACRCVNGYEGPRCEIATCRNYNPCRNGGTCYIKNNRHQCRCNKELFTGVICEQRCQEPCDNGTCVNFGGVRCFFDRQSTSQRTTQSVPLLNVRPIVFFRSLSEMGLMVGAGAISLYVMFVACSIICAKGQCNCCGKGGRQKLAETSPNNLTTINKFSTMHSSVHGTIRGYTHKGIN